MNVANISFQKEASVSYGGGFDLSRARSEGILTPHQEQWCRAEGIPLAYDPMQCGWVTAQCADDIALRYPYQSKYPASVDHANFAFRPWAVEDAPQLAAMLCSERLWQYLPEQFHGPIDTSAAAELIEVSRAAHHEVLAVVRGDVIIGQARLLFSEPGAAEISYWLGEDHWGKGYGSKIVQEFCRRSFRQHPALDRLFARVHRDHAASLRILEKTGFVQTGTDGQWVILDRMRPT